MAFINSKRIIDAFRYILSPYQFGFVVGHYYLDKTKIEEVKDILFSSSNEKLRQDYERKLAGLIGDGYVVSFAAGRMAFYTLLKVLKIGYGDEVLMTGFTCSVMVNAVLRVGAKPIFADIDPENFGPDPYDLEMKITPHTKVIVAQHSFGIPCNILAISKLAKEKNIFLVEDSAITLDSSFNGVKTGNWGDAAIFSSDHSKPINTLIGGYLYTRNQRLYQAILNASVDLPELDHNHKVRLFNRLLYEKIFFNPKNYKWDKIFDVYNLITRKIFGRKNELVFLEDDYDRPISANYHYPAKLPSFLAKVGMFELDRWSDEKNIRKNILKRYLEVIKETKYAETIPKAYLDANLEITPLRFVFCTPDAKGLSKQMASLVDINWTWFKYPIICCSKGPETMGYVPGSCPNAEKAGKMIINWPCVVARGWENKLISEFDRIIKGDHI